VSDLSIRAVLDATAIAAYGSGHVSVGEIIAEITDEGAGFAVPDLCLIEAAQRLDADQWPALTLLVAHSQCVRLELPADWRDVAAAARMLGGTHRAAAMLAAVDHRAYLLTAEPEAYGDDALPVIEV
jgi:hypothetical protein